MVGGITFSLIASVQANSSIAAVAPIRWPCIAFVEETLRDLDQLLGIYTTSLSKHFESRININTNKNGSGKIVIHFQNSDNLKDIIKNKILK